LVNLIKVLLSIIAALIGGVGGVTITILFWFLAAATTAHDPSAGGAYVAMAILTAPLGFIVGTALSVYSLWTTIR